ncbi:lysozyme family protein [Neobacillus sp. SM06]|uniref:lysozyme family protein n=1 Tax=Neobacillus sp. SM06 TaxID=3422492 RepID=UPI003D2B1CF6
MKKRRRKKSNALFILLLLVFVLIVANLIKQSSQWGLPELSFDPFANSKKYKPLIETELAKYHLENYTTVVIALMQQESRGKGGDPMQASESLGLPPNSIKDPKQSIEAGVKHFQRALVYGKSKNVDFPTIIQAYNMGIGYIDYVAQNGGKHSEELAKQFSLKQVKAKPEIYRCSGDQNNFRYPYCYGDFTYSTKVSKNIQSLTDTVPVVKNKSTADAF